MANRLVTAIGKMFRGPRTAEEGGWQTAYGMARNGSVWEMPFGDGFQRDLDHSFLQSLGVVQACTRAIGDIVSASELPVISVDSAGTETELINSPLAAIIRYPNPYQTRCTFFSLVIQALCYTGNLVVRLQRDANYRIIGWVPLPPTRHSRAYIAPDGSLWYDVSYGGAFAMTSDIDILVPAREVMHFKMPSREHPWWGDSPLTYAASAMAVNGAIMTQGAAFLNNMNRPSGVISVETTLTPPQMALLRSAWEEQSKGFNQGKVPILGSGAKWQPLGISAQDAQVIDMFKLSTLEISRVFRVPMSMLGMESNGAASSVETLINTFRATSLLFYCELIEAEIERAHSLPANEFVRFDLDNLARADKKTAMETLAQGTNNGILAPNEARKTLGLKPVEFGDEPRVQAQVVPLSQVEMSQSAPATTTAPASDGGSPAAPAPTKELELTPEYLDFLVSKLFSECEDET